MVWSQAHLEERDLILSGKPLLASKPADDDGKSYETDQHVRLMTAGKLYQLEGYIRETGLLDYGEKTVTFHTEKNRYRLLQPILLYRPIRAQQENQYQQCHRSGSAGSL